MLFAFFNLGVQEMVVLGIVGLAILSGRWPLLHLGWGTSLSVATLMTALSPSLVFEKTYDVNTGDVQVVEVVGPRHPQKVLVKVTAEHPVGAWLVRGKDAVSARQALDRGETPKAPLAGKEKGAKIVLEAMVPAGVSYTVLVKGNATRKVKVRVRIVGW
jgi:hypothetical protein